MCVCVCVCVCVFVYVWCVCVEQNFVSADVCVCVVFCCVSNVVFVCVSLGVYVQCVGVFACSPVACCVTIPLHRWMYSRYTGGSTHALFPARSFSPTNATRSMFLQGK